LNRVLLTGLLIVLAISSLSGQVEERKRLIQASGIVTDSENRPVHNAGVISQKLRRVTTSEFNGIYSIISIPGDSIIVSALGYKKYLFEIPADFDGRIFKKDITLISDTISIGGINVLPWKTYDEFKREFLANKPVVKPEILYMYENLASIQQSIDNAGAYRVSPEAGFRMAMQQNADAIMTRNQYPVNNILNPFAWAKFFSGIKSGLLRNEKSQKKLKNKNSVSGQE